MNGKEGAAVAWIRAGLGTAISSNKSISRVSYFPPGWEFWFCTQWLALSVHKSVWGRISLSENLPNPLQQIQPFTANFMPMTISPIKDSNLQLFSPLSKIIHIARSPPNT